MSSNVKTDLHVYPEGDDTGALPAVHVILWDTECDSSTLRALDRPPARCLHDDLQTSNTFTGTHNLSSASFSCSFPLFLPPAAPPTTAVIGGQKGQNVMSTGPAH